MKIQNILREKQKNFNPTHTLEPTYHSEKAENIEVFDFKKYRRGSQNKNFPTTKFKVAAQRKLKVEAVIVTCAPKKSSKNRRSK